MTLSSMAISVVAIVNRSWSAPSSHGLAVVDRLVRGHDGFVSWAGAVNRVGDMGAVATAIMIGDCSASGACRVSQTEEAV